MTAKYAVITGASRGLGRHLAHRFWSAGFSLGLVGRDSETLQQAVSDLAPAPGQVCDIFESDLADPNSASDLSAKICAGRLEINVVVNNAAIHGPIGPLEQTDLAEWEQVVRSQPAEPRCALQRTDSPHGRSSRCVHP